VQRPAAPGCPGLSAHTALTAFSFPKEKRHRHTAEWRFFAHKERCNTYLVPPLAGVPGAVEPEFDTVALASGVGVGLVPLAPLAPLVELDEPAELLVEGLDGVDELEELELDGVEFVAPVSSTFFPQAPSASSAARATAVAAAGLNLDACMCVPC
jgi:hypothetical protein